MFSNILDINRSVEKSVDVVLFSRSIPLEILVFILAAVTAFFAVRSFSASRRQNILSTVPHLFFEAQEKFPNQQLVLVNDNGKFAYNLKIEDLYAFYTSQNKKDSVISRYSFSFDYNSSKKRNFLSKENSKLHIIVKDNDKLVENDFIAWIITENVKLKEGFWVTFSDSQNLRYFTTITFNQDGVAYIKRGPTQINTFWKIYRLLRELKVRLFVLWWKIKIAYFRLFE